MGTQAATSASLVGYSGYYGGCTIQINTSSSHPYIYVGSAMSGTYYKKASGGSTFTIDAAYKSILTQSEVSTRVVLIDGAGERIFYCTDKWNSVWFVVGEGLNGILYYFELRFIYDLSGTITAYPLTTVSNEPLAITVAESAINNTSGTQIADAMYAVLIDANKASGTRIKLTNSTNNTERNV